VKKGFDHYKMGIEGSHLIKGFIIKGKEENKLFTKVKLKMLGGKKNWGEGETR